MTPYRLDVGGRLTLVGPGGAGFELIGHGDRVELRCDSLRSLVRLGSLTEAVRRLIGSRLARDDSRWAPSVTVVVRGQHLAEITRPRVMRLFASNGLGGRLVAILPGVRIGGLMKAVLFRGSFQPVDPSNGQQSRT